MELLLLSNSTTYGRPYLAHARRTIGELFAHSHRIAFVPYALGDLDAYTARARSGLAFLDAEIVGVHDAGDRLPADVDGVFIGGGNTFRLIDRLWRYDLIEAIRARVAAGLPYLGSSAGTNVAAPSIGTTNDMPIVEPRSFAALDLVPFQINPHYLDPDPTSTHQGETRDERLVQFLEENTTPVLAIREGTWLRRSATRLALGGSSVGARLYRRGHEVREIPTGADLSALLLAGLDGR